MRKVVAYELISMDGVAEEPGDWFFDVDEAVFENLGEVIGKQDAVLLGRGTYDYWSGYWPTSDVQPFADFINTTPKHVFTSTALSPLWSESIVVGTPAAHYVTDLKRLEGADIGVHGSISLVQSLLRSRLVDELRLLVAPTIAGRGRRLFQADSLLQLFELIEADRTPNGALLLSYQRKP